MGSGFNHLLPPSPREFSKDSLGEPASEPLSMMLPVMLELTQPSTIVPCPAATAEGLQCRANTLRFSSWHLRLLGDRRDMCK